MTEQTPFDTGLRLIFEALLGGVHTAFPARVESYDAATMRAEVQPCLMRKYYDSDPSNLPKITDVPIHFFSGGGFTITVPIAAGDYVLCICSERSLEQWLTKGGIVDPLDPRKFDLTDAVAIPGLFPLPGILAPPHSTDGIEIRNATGLTMMKVLDTGIEFTGPVLFKNTVKAYVVPNTPGMVVGLTTHMHPTAAVGAPSAPTPEPE